MMTSIESRIAQEKAGKSVSEGAATQKRRRDDSYTVVENKVITDP
jgi:hypothetical protein